MTVPHSSASFARLAALPKAELHIHVEGSLEPEMVFALAARNQIELPFESIDDLRDRYFFTGLQSFLDLYYACMGVLRTRADFYDLASAYLLRAHSQGVRHVEMFFDPQAHTSRGVSIDDVIDGLMSAFDEARDELDITGGLILCFLRDQSPTSALRTLESIAHRSHELIGVGLDSAEVGYPPFLFTSVFERARELGLHAVAHAGEEGPPEYVWQALDLLRAERIDHGIRSMEDGPLLDRLRRQAIPLTMCPLSNARLQVTPDLTAHPIAEMLEKGLIVTVNSDDPAYFGGYVAENYLAISEALELSEASCALLARNSIAASFASDARKSQLHSAIDLWESARVSDG
jgi:adenosine deaminase